MEMARCAEATAVPIIARLAGPDALAPLPIELEPPMATALNPEVVELKPMATPLPATSVTTDLVPMATDELPCAFELSPTAILPLLVFDKYPIETFLASLPVAPVPI